jgi:hypothetical protein
MRSSSAPFSPKVFDQQPNARGQRRDPVLVLVRKDREFLLQFAPALRCYDPTLQAAAPAGD